MDEFTDYVLSLPNNLKQILIDYTNDYDLTKDEEKIIHKIFKKGPRVMKTYTLYRGLGDQYVENIDKFMSATLDLDIAKDFIYKDCCIYVITLTPGDYSVLPLEKISVYPKEMEVLLPPGKLSIQMTKIIDDIKTVYCTYIPSNATIINTDDCLGCNN